MVKVVRTVGINMASRLISMCFSRLLFIKSGTQDMQDKIQVDVQRNDIEKTQKTESGKLERTEKKKIPKKFGDSSYYRGNILYKRVTTYPQQNDNKIYFLGFFGRCFRN